MTMKKLILALLALTITANSQQEGIYPNVHFRPYQTHLQFNEFTAELNYHSAARQEFIATWYDPAGDGVKWTMECWSPRAGKWFRPQPNGYRAATQFRWASVYISYGFRYRFVREGE